MLEKLLEEVKELREKRDEVYKTYLGISKCSLLGLKKDDNLENIKRLIKNKEKVKMENEYKFSYKDIEGKECFTSADKKKYELENRPLPHLLYNENEVFNDKDKIIVVTENEKMCDYLKNTFSKLNMFTFTTVLGGVDRPDVYYPSFYGYFNSRIVILIGREEKFIYFKEILDEVSSYIFEKYIFLHK